MTTNWILVCDAARARLFEASGQDSALTEVACYSNPELRGSAQPNGNDEPLPRTHESQGAARHAIEPHTTQREKYEHQFAHGLAEMLVDAHAQRQFEQLFLVAPPRFMGVLREAIGTPEATGVAGEIVHDFVTLSPTELHEHLYRSFPHTFHARPARRAS